MLGAIIGDIVGSRFEFTNHRSKEFELFAQECFATDDSIMTLAVAGAIMETAKEAGGMPLPLEEDFLGRLSENTVRYMRQIGRRYPDCGFGGRFFGWVFSDAPGPYNSFGNGAAMRVSPAGFAARDMEEAVQLSRAVTAVTHDHPEGIKGAEATAAAIVLARQGATQEAIRRCIEIHYYPLDFTIDAIRPGYLFNETCQETVPQAIACFLEAESFEDAIRTAVSLGGDSDTVAAITGAVAEAFWGVPGDIGERALTFLDEDLRDIWERWEEFIRGMRL